MQLGKAEFFGFVIIEKNRATKFNIDFFLINVNVTLIKKITTSFLISCFLQNLQIVAFVALPAYCEEISCKFTKPCFFPERKAIPNWHIEVLIPGVLVNPNERN